MEGARNADVSAAAKVILDDCVLRTTRRGTRSMGGTLPGIGLEGGLSVHVQSYIPHVECVAETAFHDSGDCSKTLSILFVSYQQRLFTHDMSKAGSYAVIIPEDGNRFTAGSGSTCAATVDLVDGVEESGSWYELWEGAVAVYEMCVKRGKAGISYGHGSNHYLMISLGP